MRIPVIVAAAALGLAGHVAASPAPAAAPMPAHKAFDSVPQGPLPACMDGARLSSHVAYMPMSQHPLRCSEPLSTDTLMRVHHWDRT